VEAWAHGWKIDVEGQMQMQMQILRPDVEEEAALPSTRALAAAVLSSEVAVVAAHVATCCIAWAYFPLLRHY